MGTKGRPASAVLRSPISSPIVGSKRFSMILVHIRIGSEARYHWEVQHAASWHEPALSTRQNVPHVVLRWRSNVRKQWELTIRQKLLNVKNNFEIRGIGLQAMQPKVYRIAGHPKGAHSRIKDTGLGCGLKLAIGVVEERAIRWGNCIIAVVNNPRSFFISSRPGALEIYFRHFRVLQPRGMMYLVDRKNAHRCT